jgi:hypothetical protein
LDTISLFEAAGFYFIVSRGVSQYQQTFEPNRLSQWLMMLFSLGSQNGFEVICGYTDFLAVAAACAGATAAATGWFNSLRQFDIRRFMPATGGARPKDRYSSARLLNSIYLQELDNCYQVGMLELVRTGTRYDQIFTPNNRPIEQDWPPDISTLHHWATLRTLLSVVPGGRIERRLEWLEQRVGGAQLLYADLRRRGVQFDSVTGPAHLSNWLDALPIFRAATIA